jgi:hypothetical protein
MPEEKYIKQRCHELCEHAERLREMSRENLKHAAELVRLTEKLTGEKK